MARLRVTSWFSTRIFLASVIAFMFTLAMRACSMSVFPPFSLTEHRLSALRDFMENRRCR